MYNYTFQLKKGEKMCSKFSWDTLQNNTIFKEPTYFQSDLLKIAADWQVACTSYQTSVPEGAKGTTESQNNVHICIF